MTEEGKEPVAPGAVIDGKKVKEVIRVRGIRRTLSEHMHRSLQVSAQLSGSLAIDMTEMIKCRQTLNSKEKETGVHYTYTDLFVRIVAEALKLNPIMNSSLIDRDIIIWDDINVGVALDFEMRDGRRGLIVPVVHNADKKSVLEIHQVLEEMKEKGRDGKLLPDDTYGGTFTLTNVGVFGGQAPTPGRATGMASFSTPILNQPQVGILGTGAIQDTPVVVDGEVVVRPIMYCSLTYDHRVLTGADSAAFSGTLYQLMHNPTPLLLG
jgi:pyruvate/2-oxoglutarate dehydrogenase complex dihydrolipoamide acyltransferase (E2) component